METIIFKPACDSIFLSSPTYSSRQFNLVYLGFGKLNSIPHTDKKKLPRLHRNSSSNREIRAYNARNGDSLSAWEEKPYGILPNGEISYFDEQDIVSFLDPPKELIPLDPASYNPAHYLWKKIDDIPAERRHRLLYLLPPRLVSRIWEIAGTRYENSKLVKQTTSSLLSEGAGVIPLELWNCQTSGGPPPIALMNSFKKAIFRCKDGQACGRIIIGGSLLTGLANSFSPLYFSVRQQNEVMATEQPCDVAYEFGDGLLDVDYPNGFPKPAKHPWPFNDHVVVYIRHAGPGVLVGQAWQEGKLLEQVPKKLCNEILMVKDYDA